MPEITDADRCAAAKSLLPFEAPLLILRRVNLAFRVVECRRRKTGIQSLDLSEGLAIGKAIDEGRVGGGRVLKQTGSFFGREIICERRVHVVNRGVDVKRFCNALSQRIIEEADTSSNHTVVRNAKGLPRKTESRRPQNFVETQKCVFLIGEDRLVIRLIGIVTDRFER